MFISSKCVSGANETNCALNEMSPTGLWNSLSPGLAGLHGVSAYPLQGKLAARWLTRRGKSSRATAHTGVRRERVPLCCGESSSQLARGSRGLMEFTGRE